MADSLTLVSGFPIPVMGLVAPSGTGKTQLMEQIIALLNHKHYKIGVIKHAHHGFDIDTPGKDSFRLRQAGASQTMIASGQCWALISERDTFSKQVDLATLVRQMKLDSLDIILFEGFKNSQFPKIVLHREATNKPLQEEDDYVMAYATDNSSLIITEKPVFDLNNPNEIVKFIEENFLEKHNSDN